MDECRPLLSGVARALTTNDSFDEVGWCRLTL